MAIYAHDSAAAKELAKVATARSASDEVYSRLLDEGMAKPARDGWIDLTEKGRQALFAAGYIYHPKRGWVL